MQKVRICRDRRGYGRISPKRYGVWKGKQLSSTEGQSMQIAGRWGWARSREQCQLMYTHSVRPLGRYLVLNSGFSTCGALQTEINRAPMCFPLSLFWKGKCLLPEKDSQVSCPAQSRTASWASPLYLAVCKCDSPFSSTGKNQEVGLLGPEYYHM